MASAYDAANFMRYSRGELGGLNSLAKEPRSLNPRHTCVEACLELNTGVGTGNPTGTPVDELSRGLTVADPFVRSKSELLGWLNDTLGTRLTKVEDTVRATHLCMCHPPAWAWAWERSSCAAQLLYTPPRVGTYDTYD